MKAKKILLSALALILVVAVTIVGTVAYLKSQDDATNVMTLGNVKIELNEYQWNDDATELVAFDQGKPLYPYVGTLGWKNTAYEGGAYS